MAPPRTSSSAGIATAYSLSLLSEYTHTLDSLPLDLSRNFADLRELDAVLSSSMASITAKIQKLTFMVEEGTVSKEERLFLLNDIAEEAARLKLGSDDKIRVACQAADNLKSHSGHLNTLMEHYPSFDHSMLSRKTVYPHVALRPYNPPANGDARSRRRGGYGSLLVSAADPSPAKRKRPMREDEFEAMGSRSPRKDRIADPRSRNGVRSKKTDRAASPTESVLSVTSHIPAQQSNSNNSRQTGNSSRTGNGGSNSNKRSRSSANHDNDTLLDQTVAAAAARREMFHTAPSSSSTHPSLPLPYGGATTGAHSYDLPAGHVLSGNPDWAGHPPPTQLEGPGMPVARGHSHPGMMGPPLSSTNTPVQAIGLGGDANTEGEGGEAEGDDKTYCLCDGISYGEMIACDESSCDREWFHLACIGLTIPPEGKWYCDACRSKRNAKRSGARNAKKRAGGGRSGGKAANGA